MNEAEMAVWMRGLARLPGGQDELPDAALIWWKARMLEREAARARAARPVAIAQWVSAVVGAVAAAALCVIYWPEIRGLAGPFAGVMLWAAAGCVAVAVAGRVALRE